MAPKKRKTSGDDSGTDGPRYVAGKVPRSGNCPSVDYTDSLTPHSELIKDQWSIPNFNHFITTALDSLAETYRPVFKDFIKLPSRKFHPQYFYKIDQPISINEIKSRDYEHASGSKTFILDVELLAKNCISYNEADSLIVKNAFQVVNYIKYETLKAKNFKRNYLVTDDIRVKLTEILEQLNVLTAKKVTDELPEYNLGLPDPNDDTELLVEPFVEPVSREDLPEYYEVIHRPNALENVSEKLASGSYSKIYDFVVDIQVIFDNAMVFNDPGSLIYQSAKALLEYFNHTIQDKFYPELQDLNERGEISLEYDKSDYERFMGVTNEEIRPIFEGEFLEDSDEFNHIEGLGNGYARNLFPDDFLLGPGTHNGAVDLARKLPDASAESKQTDILKFNIIESLKKDVVSEQYTMDKKPFELIKSLSIFSSKKYYLQLRHPAAGSKLPCIEKWVEYEFDTKSLSQNENTFSFTVEPSQVYLSLTADVNDVDVKPALLLNDNVVKPRERSKPDQRDVAFPQSNNLNERHGLEAYDFRLNEGLNSLIFKCSTNDELNTESMKFWINVLP